MARRGEQPWKTGWRRRAFTIIFEHDTPAGRLFDVALLWAIGGSVLVVLLDSVPHIHAEHGGLLYALEWAFTLLFTLEYVLRLASVASPARYARSFFGVVDLLSILPTYLSLVLGGAQSLAVIRSLRLLRVFRVLKLPEYMSEAGQLAGAIRASRRKITVFLVTVVTVALVVGTLMYVIEGPANGFTSIPISIYWAVVTLTTVGYGDIAPQTPAGQFVAATLMILGYGIIAVPTGIVTAELVAAGQRVHAPAPPPPPPPGGRGPCPACGAGAHDANARFCNRCGAALPAADDHARPDPAR